MSTASLQEFGWAHLTFAPRPAQSIALRVREEFGRSGYPTVRRLSCECRNNILTIMGRVPTFYQVQVAISLAMHVVPDGVVIENSIVVACRVQ